MSHWVKSNTGFLCCFSRIAKNYCVTGKNIKDQVSTIVPSGLPSQEIQSACDTQVLAADEMTKVMSREGNWRKSRKIKLIYIT